MKKITGVLFLWAVVFFVSSCGVHKSFTSTTTHKTETVDAASHTKHPTLNHSPVEIKKSSQKNKLSERQYEKYLVEQYSQMLHTPASYIKHNLNLYRFVDAWTGTPYKYGGTDMNGTDCSGLAKALFDEVYKTPLTRDAGSQFKQCEPLKKDDLMEGDLVFFKIGSKYISHVGVYLGNGKFFHASSKGVMVSDLNENYYKKYFYSGGRVKDILK
jgi:lipoprotein Spr